MNKSQLRKLAREYALGKLDENEYRQRRRDLVRDIVSGNVAIVREAPPPPPPPPPETSAEDTIEAAVDLESTEEPSRLSPVFIGVGVVIVIALVWVFLPSPEPQQAKGTVTVEQPIPEPRVSPARALVEEFVASKDWTEYSISRFRDKWSELGDADRKEALRARWFRDLTNAINEEIKTQNALVNFDTSGNAVRTGERLAALAEFLGVEDEVTAFKGAGAASAPPQEEQSAAAEPERTEPETGAPVAEQIVFGSDASTEPLVSGRKTLRTVSGTRWLDDQPAESFTLQLFAVNHLEKIQKLINSNPEVDLQVLVSAHSEPRYRVIHGSFDSAAKARAAHAALPEAIRREQPTPLVKTIGDLRKALSNGDWIRTVNADKYTLQLFATDNSDNARVLISKYPALNLSLLDTREIRSRYRVLYGTFDTEASAREAASDLPRQLVRDAGNPLVKSVGELQAARR